MIKDQPCWCITCRPITLEDMRFVVCPDCGNKRCPKANDHRNACTNSNEVGQKGSSWEHVKPMAQPEREPAHERVCIDWDTKTDEPIFATLRQRTWVGLTEDELKLMTKDDQYSGLIRAVALTVEARLKEKNS